MNLNPVIPHKEVKLKVVPIRLTVRQFERLDELRNSEGLSMQDMVRRAVDNYLEARSRAARRDNPVPDPIATAQAAQAAVAKATDTGVSSARGRKVVYR